MTQAVSAAPRLESGARRIALIVAAAMFMQNLDGAIINTSLPQIAASFAVPPVDTNIGITAYILSFAAFIPLGSARAPDFAPTDIAVAGERAPPLQNPDNAMR